MDRLLALPMEERQQWLYDKKGHPAFNDLHVDTCALCSNVLYDDAPLTPMTAEPPSATFRLKFHDEICSKIVATVRLGEQYHIADVFFNGAEWLYVRLDRSGEVVHPIDRWLNVDPEQWSHLREMTNENAKGREERPQAVNEALDAALAARRRQFRDDTREDAELLARGMARVWWKTYALWLRGCTGTYDSEQKAMSHDGDTCPIHEL